MAILIDEQKMVDDNTFLYEDRIKSPTSRFIDTTPIYVTYYHINNNESTTDDGFIDINSLNGKRSPLRFNKVEKFPLYGIDQVILQLSDTDQGLDSTYEGDGIILPGTIKPSPNDFFIIPSLKDYYVFRITSIGYDNVMPDNFYRIEYRLEYNDRQSTINLENQVVKNYTCILENIGTDENCIIEKDTFDKVSTINDMYNKIIDFYKAMFYDTRHNVLMYTNEENYTNIYDPFLGDFINKNHLLQQKNDLETIILTDEYTDPKRAYKYSKSIYKYIETKDSKLLSRFPYMLRPAITVHESSFYRWHDKSTYMVDIPEHMPNDCKYMMSCEAYNYLKNGEEFEHSEYFDLISKYVLKQELSISDISLDLDQELIYLNNSFEVYIYTPILMYIIRDLIKKETLIQRMD